MEDKNFLISDDVQLVAEFNAQKFRQPTKFIIGDNSTIISRFLNKTIHNKPLQFGTYYHTTIILMNEFKSKKRYAVYVLHPTQGIEEATGGLYALLLLLIIPGVVYWIVLK